MSDGEIRLDEPLRKAVPTKAEQEAQSGMTLSLEASSHRPGGEVGLIAGFGLGAVGTSSSGRVSGTSV